MQTTSLYETTARTKTFDLNKDIAEYLRELGEMTSDFYKTAAYRRAADIVANLDHEVESGESLQYQWYRQEYRCQDRRVSRRVLRRRVWYRICWVDQWANQHRRLRLRVRLRLRLFRLLQLWPHWRVRQARPYEEDPHKRDAYWTAADAIYHLPFEVKNGSELASGPKKVKGIGKGIAKKIDEFLETGNIKKLQKIEYPNEKLADMFDSLCTMRPWVQEDSYDDAAYIISRLTFKVTSGEELAKGPKKVPGIGKGIAKKIDEFLKTGKIKRLEELKKTTSTNEEVARALEEFAEDLEDPFKVSAYENAAEVIRKLDFEVTSGEELAKGPKKVKGIGKGIAKRIDTFLQTGEMN